MPPLLMVHDRPSALVHLITSDIRDGRWHSSRVEECRAGTWRHLPVEKKITSADHCRYAGTEAFDAARLIYQVIYNSPVSKLLSQSDFLTVLTFYL